MSLLTIRTIPPIAYLSHTRLSRSSRSRRRLRRLNVRVDNSKHCGILSMQVCAGASLGRPLRAAAASRWDPRARGLLFLCTVVPGSPLPTGKQRSDASLLFRFTRHYLHSIAP